MDIRALEQQNSKISISLFSELAEYAGDNLYNGYLSIFIGYGMVGLILFLMSGGVPEK